jgi:inner membrane transporter RhtA
VATTRRSAVPAQALVVTSILSVQLGAAIGRSIFDELGAAGVSLLRVAIAAAILWLVLRPAVRSWSRASWQAAIVLGVTMAAMNLLFYLSLRTVPLGVAVTVEFLGPLTLALVQTRRAIDLLWALLAGAGVALLGFGAAGSAPLGGLLLAAGAGAFWALYIVASARLGQELPGTDGLAVALSVAAVLIAPVGLPGALRVLDHPGLLFTAAAVAVLSSIVPYALELEALRRLSTRVFGVLMSLEPAAGAVAGLVILGQRLNGREVVALAIVSVASLGVTLGRADEPVPLQPLE